MIKLEDPSEVFDGHCLGMDLLVARGCRDRRTSERRIVEGTSIIVGETAEALIPICRIDVETPFDGEKGLDVCAIVQISMSQLVACQAR